MYQNTPKIILIQNVNKKNIMIKNIKKIYIFLKMLFYFD